MQDDRERRLRFCRMSAKQCRGLPGGIVMKRTFTIHQPLAVGLAVVSTLAAGCVTGRRNILDEIARSDRQWTGVAVSDSGRIFVNYPRWSDDVPVSVAELKNNDKPVPYPDEVWNRWDPNSVTSARSRFVCVQSVYIDANNALWILDAANPRFEGVVKGGPKLVKVDLADDRVLQTVYFDSEVALKNSYLNDVRIDEGRGVAYITDSGAGGLIVVDLETGRSRRVLADHPSTRSEDVAVTIGESPWMRPDGSRPRVHADGIALSADREYLYYHALTGHTLYRIETRWLRPDAATTDALGAKVETVTQTGPVDGIIFGPDGALYLTALEENAVKRLTLDGRNEIVVQDPRLAWPDTFAVGPEGALYVTTSQIHTQPNPEYPYFLFKIER